MGTIREFECLSCRKAWKVYVGHGIMHGALNHVLKEFPASIQQEILSGMNGEQDTFFKFNFCVASCPACQDIVAVPVIDLLLTGQTYSSGCPECGSKVLMPEEDSGFMCPSCKESQLLARNSGSWD